MSNVSSINMSTKLEYWLLNKYKYGKQPKWLIQIDNHCDYVNKHILILSSQQ